MHYKVHITFTFSVHSYTRHEIMRDMGKATLMKKQGAVSDTFHPELHALVMMLPVQKQKLRDYKP